MLYHRTNDVKKLQKVIADTELQFIECFQQIKTLGEEKEQRRKELEDLRVAAQQLVEVVDPQDDGAASRRAIPAGLTPRSSTENPVLHRRGPHHIC
jgi:hypothetical protein